MHERTRYRISGSLFLLALAVIFIPMVFDGRGDSNKPIPPMPAAPVVQPLAHYDEVVPASNVVEEVTELFAEVDDDGFSVQTGEKFGEPILLPPTDQTGVWAVQAASFAKVENARSLRVALRETGLEAFISQAIDPQQPDAAPLHRVAVGPLFKRQDADSIATQIRQEFSLEPQLVEMRP